MSAAIAAIAPMRSRLTLETPVDVTDDNGGVTRSYAAYATLWGTITPARANDRFVAERMEQSITHMIRLRFRPDITGAMRLRLGVRVFIIHGVEDVAERHRFTLCSCEEIRP